MITHASLHYYILTEIVDKGYAPSNDTIAKHFSTSIREVESALLALQDYHGVVLHPNSPRVWVVHPFSTAPTNFYVKSDRGQWWGNCAWCSLGVAALVGGDITISTTIGAEGKRRDIQIRDGKIMDSDLYIHFPIPMQNAWDNVVYTCSTMLVFESEAQVREWSIRHDIPLGDIQPIETIWRFSRKWYGNHLAEDWKKWTADEARALFTEFGLTHPIWDLRISEERF